MAKIKFKGKAVFLGGRVNKKDAVELYASKRAEFVEIHKANMRRLGHWSEDVISRLR